MTAKQKTLVGGVSILGIAGIICKVVGVLYRIPLAHLIGPEGMGVYHKVYPAYNLLLTISSAGLPVAISRMVAHYVTREDPRNARRIFTMAMRMLLVLGLLTTLLMLLFSGQLAAWQGTQESKAGYLAIAPSLFFVCVMSAYRGFLQGQRNMVPTAVSQLIEQIGRVFIALPFAYWGMQRGGMALGAAGALLGGTIAEGAALLYMLLQHKKADQALDFVPQRDGESPIASSIIAQRLIRVSIPITLGACIVPLAGFIDSIMLTQLMERAGMTAEDALVRYGSYAGPVLTLINVPTALHRHEPAGPAYPVPVLPGQLHRGAVGRGGGAAAHFQPHHRALYHGAGHQRHFAGRGQHDSQPVLCIQIHRLSFQYPGRGGQALWLRGGDGRRGICHLDIRLWVSRPFERVQAHGRDYLVPDRGRGDIRLPGADNESGGQRGPAREDQEVH